MSVALAESFGERVRHRRESLGLSRAQLAAVLDRGEPTIVKWERGEVHPRLPMLTDLADALDCSPSDLIDGRRP